MMLYILVIHSYRMVYYFQNMKANSNLYKSGLYRLVMGTCFNVSRHRVHGSSQFGSSVIWFEMEIRKTVNTDLLHITNAHLYTKLVSLNQKMCFDFVLSVLMPIFKCSMVSNINVLKHIFFFYVLYVSNSFSDITKTYTVRDIKIK